MVQTDELTIELQADNTFGISMSGDETLGVTVDPRAPTVDNDYNTLRNKPQIEGNELIGNKTLLDLGLAQYTVDFGKVMYHTKAEWESMTQLMSEEGAIYIYLDEYEDGDELIPAIKIGDGLAYVIDLPFIDQIYAKHIINNQIHITAEEREKWDNKVTCYASGERVIFTKDNIIIN